MHAYTCSILWYIVYNIKVYESTAIVEWIYTSRVKKKRKKLKKRKKQMSLKKKGAGKRGKFIPLMLPIYIPSKGCERNFKSLEQYSAIYMRQWKFVSFSFLFYFLYRYIIYFPFNRMYSLYLYKII